MGCKDKKTTQERQKNGSFQSASKIAVFPNPSTNHFKVTDETESITKVKLFSLLGTNVKNFDLKANDLLDISDLQKGLYLAQMFNAQDQLIRTIRIRKI